MSNINFMSINEFVNKLRDANSHRSCDWVHDDTYIHGILALLFSGLIRNGCTIAWVAHKIAYTAKSDNQH